MIINGPGLSQCEKRTRYFDAGIPGDLMFIIDADESVVNAERLRDLSWCDIGWVRVQSPLYTRSYGQPRIFRWRPGMAYKGRHHWIYEGDRFMSSHQYSGAGYANITAAITLNNQRRLGRNAERLQAKATHHRAQYSAESVQIANPPFSTMSDQRAAGRESLQIAHIAYRDDGLAPSRLHTAINRTTPHSSVFFKRRPGPFQVPSQYLVKDNPLKMSSAMQSADIVHYHGAMSMARGLSRRDAMVVFHQHGTLFRRNAEQYMRSARLLKACVLLSNLELFTWTNGERAFFLPNAMPVARYRALSQQYDTGWDGSGPFRIAHSPSHPSRKGTKEFLEVCESLNKNGYFVQPVILNDLPHRDVLAQKATCHAAFDSFWLGIQCSGLEAASMALPVIAGDPIVSKRYLEYFHAVPYTYANDKEQLEDVIKRLVSDKEFYRSEASRVFTYTQQYHDEAAVALRYLDILDEVFSWRQRATASSRFVPKARRRMP